jgi:ABC-type antimicrobial peptide transport system permease subunit
VLSSGAGLGAAIAAETGTELGELEIRARGYWEQVWRRLRRDRAALAGGVFIVLLVVAAFPGAWLASKLVGHGPNEIFSVNALDPVSQLPVGPLSHVRNLDQSGSTFLVLGPTASSAATSSCGCSTAPASRSRWLSGRRSSRC